MGDKELYIYEGPVVSYGRCIANYWKGETWATSKSKARSNLIYQFNKANNRIASTKIELPGEIRIAS